MAKSCIEQVLEATPHKTSAVQPPTTHHENYAVRRIGNARPCWGSEDELINDVLQWTCSGGQAKVGRTARTY